MMSSPKPTDAPEPPRRPRDVLWIAGEIRGLLRSTEGAVAIQVAIMAAVLLGMAALAIDVGLAYSNLRRMQTAADAAAFSAAIAKSAGVPADFATEAAAVAGQNGFVDGAGGAAVAINSPPVSPPASAADAANAGAVQVIIQQPQPLPLASLLYSGGFRLKAQAVAGPAKTSACNPADRNSPCACVLSLDANAGPAVAVWNGATVRLNACGLQVCSAAGQALALTDGAQLDLANALGTLLTDQSQAVSIVGDASVGGGATNNGHAFCFSCVAIPACAAATDPYVAVADPVASGGCSLGSGVNYPPQSSDPAYVLSPGVWCDGVTFGQGQRYQLNPGVYYVAGGRFAVQSGATVSGTGVTIVLTGGGVDSATLDIAGTVSLTAPTGGATAGIVFFGDRNAPSSGAQIFEAGATVDVVGAIYFPTQQVIVGGVSSSSPCTQLIAGTVQFSGDAVFSRNCAGVGITPIGAMAGPVMLLE